MAAAQLHRSAYTIGWICALHIEYTAAQEFLDKEHAPVDDDLEEGHDDNHYTFGSIGKHNVVIAVLPSGEYGTASAASVAKDLARSFPNVRIGLMVGIGGGAPSADNDIRLGDIVVSTPSDGHSGVFQYDFGKTVQERNFQHTRVMNQPPAVLRTAVAGLRSRHERKGHDLEAVIESTLSNNKRLRKKYGKPDASSDILFQSSFIHEGGSCEATCTKDSSNLINRYPRDEDEDKMQIHYGLIASSNSLMKDAPIRDQLIRDRNVLCFEMEAGGLMNTFPCLVIRGICDYSDSHKNKVWQGYAAMAAAAYARALCLEVKATSIERESKILDVISEVREATIAAQDGVREIHETLDANADRRILDWLSSETYGPQHSDVSQNRSPGTGKWLLESQAYHEWVTAEKQTLFCPGIPGAGKTVITSTVIDDLIRRHGNNSRVGIAFVYCNFRQQSSQGLEKLLGSITRQLLSRMVSMPESVRQTFLNHEKSGTRPTPTELMSALEEVVQALYCVYIVVDALDECQSPDGEQTKLPEVLFGFQQNLKINFLATSRHIPSIEQKFKGMPCIEIAATSDDLTTYLEANMSLLPGFVSEDTSLQLEIKEQLIKASQGMFLVARLYVHSLIDKHNVRSLKDALQKLNDMVNHSHLSNRGAVLDVAYGDIFERIRGQLPGFRELAERVLSWVAFGRQRFTAEGLQAMVATRAGERTFDMDNLTNIDILISVCCGLVTLQLESNVVQLVHYTTQVYLEDNKDIWLPDAYSVLANDCITHLMYDLYPDEEQSEGDLVSSPVPQTLFLGASTFSERVHTFTTKTLQTYASYYWGHHVAVAERYEGIVEAVDDFLASKKEVNHAASVLADSPLFTNGQYEFFPDPEPDPFQSRCLPSLHLAAFFGLVDRCRDIIEMDPRTVDALFIAHRFTNVYTTYRTREFKPLHFAILGGHTDILDFLVEKGAAIDTSFTRTISLMPLGFACYHCSTDVLEALIHKGANVNAQGLGNLWTPLHSAVQSGRADIVQFLIDKGADTSIYDRNGRTPLMVASANGRNAIIQLLIRSGAELDLQDNEGFTALLEAAHWGYDETVELLIANNCSINHSNRGGWTAAMCARSGGHSKTARILVEAGSKLPFREADIPDFLLGACVEGDYDMLQMLLEHHAKGVDVYKRGISPNSVRSLVETAAGRGYPDLLRLLMSKTNGPPAKIEPRHTEVLFEGCSLNQLECVSIIADNLSDEPENEVFPQLLLYIARLPDFVDNCDAFSNLMWFCHDLESRLDILNPALLEASKCVRKMHISKSVTGGAALALERSAFAVETVGLMQLLLNRGANPHHQDEIGFCSLDYAQKCDGENMIRFMDAIGIDPFFWRVLELDGLTWYSGMSKDYEGGAAEHMEVWQEDYTETYEYGLRFHHNPFPE